MLAQYQAFFQAINPVWGTADAAERARAFSNVAVEPEYTQFLANVKATRDVGQVGFGSYRLHPVLASLTGDTAEVHDCQDTSEVGRKKESTGERVTHGYVDDLAQVFMKRQADGAWKVSKVGYAAAGSCHYAK